MKPSLGKKIKVTLQRKCRKNFFSKEDWNEWASEEEKAKTGIAKTGLKEEEEKEEEGPQICSMGRRESFL